MWLQTICTELQWDNATNIIYISKMLSSVLDKYVPCLMHDLRAIEISAAYNIF